MDAQLGVARALDLGVVLRLQQQAVDRHAESHSEVVGFINDCVVAGMLACEEWQDIALPRRAVYYHFHGDAFSTLLNATRLALQGCDTDAYALARVSLETLVVLDCIMETDSYGDAFMALATGRGAKKFTYKAAMKKLDVTDGRRRAWGSFSTFGSHGHIGRARLVRYADEGPTTTKVGVAVNNPRTEVVLRELAQLWLFALRLSQVFFDGADKGGFLVEPLEEIEDAYRVLGSEAVVGNGE